MRTAILLLLAFAFFDAVATETYKCRDRAGRITYSNSTCESQGLKSAGAVRDRTTVIPGAPRPTETRRAEPAPKRSRAAPPVPRKERAEKIEDAQASDAAEPTPGNDEEPRPRGAVIAPVNPLIRRGLK